MEKTCRFFSEIHVKIPQEKGPGTGCDDYLVIPCKTNGPLTKMKGNIRPPATLVLRAAKS